MKKLALLMVAVMTVIGTPAWAASSATATASASVGAVLDLSIDIRALDGTGNPTGSNLAPNMPFGTMQRNGNNAMYGQQALAVFLGVNASSRKYAISTTMGAMTLSGGTTTLPNAMVCEVVSATAGGTDITGDIPVTGAKSAIMTTSTLLYTSNNGGTSASVQLVYGISGGPAPFTGWAGVPPDQASGTYNATATYTVALV